MRKFDPAATAASWRRPYTSMQRAWVRALRIAPGRAWEDAPRRVRKRRRGRPSRGVRECFENRRRVDLQDRS